MTTRDAGQCNQAIPDEELLAFAVADGREVLTFDRKHVIRLQSIPTDHRGILASMFDPDFSGQAERIHEAVGKLATLDGQLIRVNRPYLFSKQFHQPAAS